MHVSLSIANNCFRIHPHKCYESGAHPIFLFPTSYFIHHSTGTGELGLRSGGIFQVESIVRKGLPELPQDVFPCVFGSSALFGIWPNSPCLSSNKIFFLFFPCCRGHRRNSARLSSGHRLQEQVPKHHLIDSARAAGAICRRGSPFRRRPRGNISFTTDTLDTHHFFTCLQKHTMSSFCLAILIPLTIQSHDADTNVRVGWEQAQNTCSGKITENTSCRSRVSKCRMYYNVRHFNLFISVSTRSHRTPISAISHTDDAPVPTLVPARRSVHSAVLDLPLILVRRPFLRRL